MTTLRNFTPLIHTILKRFGLYAAAVYGRIWRYEQGSQGCCNAGQNTIADELGISRATVNRKIQDLIKAGYLIDLTPNRKNKPHDYKTTGKAGIRNISEAFDTVAESYSGVTKNHSTVAESYSDSNLELHEDRKKKEVKKGKSKDTQISKTYHPEFFELIMQATGLDPKIKSNASQIGKLAKELIEAGYEPELFKKFYVDDHSWWLKNDWRGQKGSKPTLKQIRDTIGLAAEWQAIAIQPLTKKSTQQLRALKAAAQREVANGS